MSSPDAPPEWSPSDRLSFERLLADLSARFVNLPPTEVDPAIEQSLRQIVEALDVDRSSVVEVSEESRYRELRNVVERAVILSPGPTLNVDLPAPLSQLTSTDSTLEAIWRRHITKVLDETHWRIRGAGGAAERLGLKPSTLESRIRKLGIRR